MNQGPTAEVIEEAAAWHVRIDAADMDWDEFAAWLEADPAHRDAYDRVALLDSEILAAAAALHRTLPANDDAGGRQEITPSSRPARARWILGGGLATAVVALAAGLPLLTGRPDVPLRNIATGRGEVRAVALADGTRIRIDRSTRVRIADGRSPTIEVAAGTANFTVRHNPSRQFVVRVGDYDVSDIGTSFDISRSAGRIAVLVAEGAVNVAQRDNADRGITVGAGQRLDIADGSGVAERSRIDPAVVGGWRSGRLVYDNAPLALVAADISRYAGTRVKVDLSATDIRFSGVLTIGDGSRLVEQLQKFVPIRVRRAGGDLHLERAP